MVRKEGESITEYLKRMDSIMKRSCNNIEKISNDMEEDEVSGFCSNCGCNIYEDKEHKCSD